MAGARLNDAPKWFLVGPDRKRAVFIGRDRQALQTCLYLGGDPDMSAVDALLDGSILRQIDDVLRIRGDGPKSLIVAHGLGDDARAFFDPPLRFAMTFTVVLDRQPGDLR